MIRGTSYVVRVEGQPGEIPERMSETGMSQLVADAAAGRCRRDEVAVPQTGEVVGHVGACEVQVVCQICGERRPTQQSDQDAPPCLIGQCAADSTERLEIDGRGE